MKLPIYISDREKKELSHILEHVRHNEGLKEYIKLKKFFINATYGVSIYGKISLNYFIDKMKSHFLVRNERVKNLWALGNRDRINGGEKVFEIPYSIILDENPNVMEIEIANLYRKRTERTRFRALIKDEYYEDIKKMFK